MGDAETIWKRLNTHTDRKFDVQLQIPYSDNRIDNAEDDVVVRSSTAVPCRSDASPSRARALMSWLGASRPASGGGMGFLAEEKAWDHLFQLPRLRSQTCELAPAQVQT